MLAIDNRTPFPAAIFPGLDGEGYDTATILVKGTFSLHLRRTPTVADEQVPVTYGDKLRGDPATSSVALESDACPAKRGTDVIVLGHAYAPPRATQVDVALTAGPLHKVVRVFGNRVWCRVLGAWEMSRPAPFDRAPLIYENAFGGADVSGPDPSTHASERRNPVGTGFSTGRNPARTDGLRLPNLEDPRLLIAAPEDTPPPACFAFVGRSWMPRAALAGTYDERWKRERCPFLPLDFDDRYHNGAPADLIARRHFKGGEPVVLTNASPDGEVRFEVPGRLLEVAVRIRGEQSTHAPVLDTVVIEPDERRVVLSWRTTLRCPRSFLFIEKVTVRDGTAGA